MTLTPDLIREIVLGLLGLVVVIGYVLRKRADGRVALDLSAAKLSDSKAAEHIARADVLRLEAETRRADAETTGKFATQMGKDREQVAEFIDSLRDRLKAADARITKLESDVADREHRIVELTNAIGSLWDEVQAWQRAHASGGAYPAPSERPRHLHAVKDGGGE